MSESSVSQIEKAFHEANGAIDILDVLREEMEQWLEEAQDSSKHEALENVLGHIEVMDVEYKKRRKELMRRLSE